VEQALAYILAKRLKNLGLRRDSKRITRVSQLQSDNDYRRECSTPKAGLNNLTVIQMTAECRQSNGIQFWR
jgi:hypothetical protein